ncbi:MAG TPA: MBL fold metallo-hydrolase, partial [Polyangiaceae bacterium]|nr:MBL fold metallo-hydrolase [Polyangiaceae bacterium]
MIPFETALGNLGLRDNLFICPVQSGYPSPKLVNLVLRKYGGKSYLFEASAARDDVVAETFAHLDAHGVSRLDGLLVTHCHGDHAGSAGIVAARGYPDGERAPIFLHSANYRFLTHPEAAFL